MIYISSLKPTSTMQISVALDHLLPLGNAALRTAEEKELPSIVAIYCFNRCLDVFLSVFSR